MNQIAFRNLSKSFAGFVALNGVDLDLRAGECHAVMGENGAGKSTLIKLIAGVVRADSMAVAIDGVPVALGSPVDAKAAGFRFIHQELNIVPQMSVAENILLGHPSPRRFGFAVDWTRLQNRAAAALDQLGVSHIRPDLQAGRLPNGDRMLIRIASALVADPGAEAVLYVLDEPTAALTSTESDKLFAVLDRLKARGAAVLYVSHRMNEVMAICDRVTVLRDGSRVLTGTTAAISRPELVAAMTGRDGIETYPPRRAPIGTATRCAAYGVATLHLADLNFTLRDGEILGVAGLAEAGQSRVLRAFLGLEAVCHGSLTLQGRPGPGSPAEAWGRGVAYVPRERRAEGVMLHRSIRGNVTLPHLGAMGWLAHRGRETALTLLQGGKAGLKSTGPEQSVWQLSGGNQQKVVFARALGGDPSLLLLDEPTRGVDVGAKFDIYTLLRELSARGTAILLASSDLPELLGLCDRILILHGGRQTQIVATQGLTAADLLAKFYEPARDRAS